MGWDWSTMTQVLAIVLNGGAQSEPEPVLLKKWWFLIEEMMISYWKWWFPIEKLWLSIEEMMTFYLKNDDFLFKKWWLSIETYWFIIPKQVLAFFDPECGFEHINEDSSIWNEDSSIILQ